MVEEDVQEDVLVLDHELLLGDGAEGEGAFPIEPDVLLLDEPLPAAGPIMAVDLGPRRQAAAVPEPRFGRGPQTDKPLASPSAAHAGSPATADSSAARDRLERLLQAARQSAQVYRTDEARTRKALYATLAAAYDLSAAVMQDARGFAQILRQAGLTMQSRAPMTPVLKLVFGTDFDKTRLTEYAAVLAHGHRKLVPPGGFAEFLAQARGGLKGIVEMERICRRGEQGRPEAVQRIAPRPHLAERLRELCSGSLDRLTGGGDEFTLVILRRMPDGTVCGVGEVPRDVALLEKAARRLLDGQVAGESSDRFARVHDEVHGPSPRVPAPPVRPTAGLQLG